MSTGIIRSLSGAVVDTNAKKRTIRAVWSTDETDHYKTAFVQQGIDTSTFAQNPVILYEHGLSAERGSLPIANATEWGVERYKGKNALIGSARFWDSDAFAEARWQDYSSGRLKAWSIRLLPGEASPPTREERRAGWADAELVYRSGVLAEVSTVSVPGNRNTLTLSVERSMGGTIPANLPLSDATVRTLAADFRRSLDQAGQDIRAKIAGMTMEELAEFAERMKLEHSAHHFLSLRESQDRRREHEAKYAAMSRENGGRR